MLLRALSALCLAALFSACSAQDQPDAPPIDYDCLEPKRAYIFNWGEVYSRCLDVDGVDCSLPGLAFPKGRETRLEIRIFDASGHPCDPSMTTVSFESADFSVSADGEDFLVVAMRDAFDNGLVEPSAVMTVSQGPLVAQWQAMAVVDLVGSWEITVDDLTVGDFEVAQSGRFIRWSQCEPDDTRPECSAGEIRADLVKLHSPIGALMLEGAVLPTRDSIDGSWANGEGQYGQWHAKKLSDE